jgi:hypothetical protein
MQQRSSSIVLVHNPPPAVMASLIWNTMARIHNRVSGNYSALCLVLREIYQALEREN